MERKYVMFNDCFPIIFSSAMQHSEFIKMEREDFKITGSGFVSDILECYGESKSLPKISDKKFDTLMVRKLFEGMDIVDLVRVID